jgi:hypothetical protein
MYEIVENGLKAGGIGLTPLIDEGFKQVITIEDFLRVHLGIIYLYREAFENKKVQCYTLYHFVA